ncbi:DUF1801 domain-containing protein [Reinekea sp.]|jgi:hypothetical protein|uniref:DUF1801 domain-containing protein n=1 Tax=Reinekea sp. TaxID=1970455 RepID=UPI003988EA4C
MDKDIQSLLETYPEPARRYLLQIRDMILDIADEESLGSITESLKWGEPSFASKKGSPIRMDWKAKHPNAVSIFFNCKTTLVEISKEIYGSAFQFVGNREIVIPIDQPLPTQELRGCLTMALRYHELKHLPLLGA